MDRGGLADDGDGVAAWLQQGEGGGVFALVEEREGADVVGGEDEFAEVVGLAPVGVGDDGALVAVDDAELRVGERAADVERCGGEGRADAADEEGSLAGAAEDDAEDERGVAGGGAGEDGDVGELRRAGDVAEVVDFDEDDAGGVGVAGDLGGVAAAGGGGVELDDEGGVLAAGGEREGADGGEGGSDGAVPVVTAGEAGGAIVEVELRIGHHGGGAETEAGEGGADGAEEDFLRQCALDREDGDRTVRVGQPDLPLRHCFRFEFR